MASRPSYDGLVEALHVGQRHRVADAGDDVLALGVLQVVAVHPLVAGGRVTGEGDARAGVVAAVAEHHGLDVDRRARTVGDALLSAVEHRALGVPRVEDRSHRQLELLARVLWEGASRVVLDGRLERVDQAAQVVDAEVGVGGGVALLLELVEGVGEDLGLDAEHGGTEHLQQAAVGVHREPLVSALLGQTSDRLVVETDVEHRLHHPGHRHRGPGPDTDQERVRGVAEAASHRLLQRAQVAGDLLGEPVGQVAGLEVGPTGCGRDREAGRHRETQVGHLGQVGSLAAQKVLLVLVALGELVDVGHGRHLPLSMVAWPSPVRSSWLRDGRKRPSQPERGECHRSRRTPARRRRPSWPGPTRCAGR